MKFNVTTIIKLKKIKKKDIFAKKMKVKDEFATYIPLMFYTSAHNLHMYAMSARYVNIDTQYFDRG